MAIEPEMPTVVSVPPMKISADQLQQGAEILAMGRAVSVPSALKQLPRAHSVTLAVIGGRIVGLAAIKQPRPLYAKKTMANANYRFSAQMNELGYVAVHPDCSGRGIAGRLLNALLAKFEGPLFSTTDNEKMMISLRNRGFQKCGSAWRGNRGILSLWIREAS